MHMSTQVYAQVAFFLPDPIKNDVAYQARVCVTRARVCVCVCRVSRVRRVRRVRRVCVCVCVRFAYRAHDAGPAAAAQGGRADSARCVVLAQAT